MRISQEINISWTNVKKEKLEMTSQIMTISEYLNYDSQGHVGHSKFSDFYTACDERLQVIFKWCEFHFNSIFPAEKYWNNTEIVTEVSIELIQK
jgi:hypothetical protein